MAKKQFKRFDSVFTYEDLEARLSGLTPSSAYSFTKRNDRGQFDNLLKLLPPGYAGARLDDIEQIDLVYSGSTDAPYLLTIAVGRNDVHEGREVFDIDVMNIAPDTGATASYFRQQWHHFKDDEGNRVSFDIHPLTITDEERRKDVTYASFLTGSTTYFSLEQYQKEKPDFFDLHTKSFRDLGQ